MYQMNGQEKVDLVSAVTHELKTWLTSILASAELLADELQPASQSLTDKIIHSITHNARRMDERISLLPQIDRMRGEAPHYLPEPLEIGQAIGSATAQIYSITQSKNQSVTLELADFTPPVMADKQCLEQILLNLLTNASKFTPEGGWIKITAWQDGDSLIVQVSDNGIGIPADEQEQVFLPYYQVNQIGSGRPGVGLGLPISRFLAELQGGKLWLRSTPGQGSSFLFSLPLAGK